MNAQPTTSSSKISSGMNSCKNQPKILAFVGVMQQPAPKARIESQPAAFFIGSALFASHSHFHPGPYTDTHLVVISKSESATEAADPSVGTAVRPALKL